MQTREKASWFLRTKRTGLLHNPSGLPLCVTETSMVTECPYCHADIPADEARELPALDDNAAWARLEMLHDHGCQWIATRGLQIT
jgi:hypothetical protein